MPTFKSAINVLLHRFGYEIIKRHPLRDPAEYRARLIRSAGVDLVIDVGANKGQFGEELRRSGYAGRLVSIEPISSAYETLVRRCNRYSNWTALNMALGAAVCDGIINVARNSAASSLLKHLSGVEEAFPTINIVTKEKIQVSTLDEVFPGISNPSTCIFLKLDVQGYEAKVLQGGVQSLQFIDYLQIELSLEPIYVDELTFTEMHKLLDQFGFDLVAIQPTVIHPTTSAMAQVDGIYRRRKPAPARPRKL